MNIELKELLKNEKNIYLGQITFFRECKLMVTEEPIYQICKFVKYLRICEFYKEKGKFYQIFLAYYRRKKNKFGNKMNIEIHEGCFGPGLLIYHGNIVVNANAKIGCNCKLHGCNCIGNKGTSIECPTVGDNAELGFGSGIFGAIKIANGTTIGANAVIIKDVNEEFILGRIEK